jgi:murein DD-endopeptidase MepM/ murein hydrolase activator NlpD
MERNILHDEVNSVNMLSALSFESVLNESDAATATGNTLPHSSGITGLPLKIEQETCLGYTCYIHFDLKIGSNLGQQCITKINKETKEKRQVCFPIKGSVQKTTAIFAPSHFNSEKPADVILYLHGHVTGYPGITHKHPYSPGIKEYLNYKPKPWFNLREVIEDTGKNIILIAPSLGPRSQYGNLVNKFDDYVAKVMLAINEYLIRQRGLNGQLKLNRFIIAAHSGGGMPMLGIASSNSKYAKMVSEYWGFDSWYNWGGAGKTSWEAVAKKNPEVKIFGYYYHSNSIPYRPLRKQRQKQTENFCVVRSANIGSSVHFALLLYYLKQRLNNTACDTPVAGQNEVDFFSPTPMGRKQCTCKAPALESELANEDIYKHEQTDFEAVLDYEGAIFQKYLYEAEVATVVEPKPFLKVPFALIPPTGSYWPLVSKMDPIVSYYTVAPYKGKSVIGSEARTFGYSRINYNTGQSVRHHVGIDLFAKFKDPVVAIQKGTIIKFSPFCCGKNKTSWSLMVDHGDVVINYGEVDKTLPSGLKIGKTVEPGQLIAYVGRNPKGSSMLHFEMYKKGTKHAMQWFKGKKTPDEILNPTKYLLHLRDLGLRADVLNKNTPVPDRDIVNGHMFGSSNGLDIQKAIRLNEQYARQLGWGNYVWDIERLLGFTNMSPSRELFAEEVFKWQLRNGLNGASADGIIGPTSWKLMRAQLKRIRGVSNSGGSPSVPVLTTKDVKILNASYDGMKGFTVKRTASPDVENIKTDDDIITACVSEVEGGFDTVICTIKEFFRGELCNGLCMPEVYKEFLDLLNSILYKVNSKAGSKFYLAGWM